MSTIKIIKVNATRSTNDKVKMLIKSKKIISGDILISTERVFENAKIFDVNYLTELHRVMVHGLLHLLGYKDKNEKDADIMREKENYYLNKIIN